MDLNIIDDIGKWFEKTMKDLEQLIIDHYSEPLFWVLIVVIVLAIFAFAFNSLSDR